MKNVLFLLFSCLLFSQQNKNAITNDLILNLKLSNNDKMIVLGNKYVIVLKNKGKELIANKICENKVIYSKKLNSLDYEKCLSQFSQLSNINPKHLEIQKNEKGVVMKIEDGFDVKVELFDEGERKLLNSYSPQDYIDAKFPFYEERQLYVDIYDELIKYFFDEEYIRLRELDSIYIFIDKSFKSSNLIHQNSIKNKRQENYFIKFDCASFHLINFNRNDYTKPQNYYYLKKSFLKKNKDKIIEIKYLNQFFDCELNQIIGGKPIFIIDEKKKKSKKFLVVEFKGGTTCF